MHLVHMSAPATGARVYAGRWVVDCPMCSGAIAVPLIPFGAPAFQCVDCPAIVEIRWPSDDLRAGVERLLSMRPVPHTRNWFPGETLHELLEENIVHGIGPTAPGQEMMILGDRIERDTLPATPERLMIGA